MFKTKVLYYIVPIVTGIAAITVGIIASNYSKTLDKDQDLSISSSIVTIDEYNNHLSEDEIRLNKNCIDN